MRAFAAMGSCTLELAGRFEASGGGEAALAASGGAGPSANITEREAWLDVASTSVLAS